MSLCCCLIQYLTNKGEKRRVKWKLSRYLNTSGWQCHHYCNREVIKEFWLVTTRRKLHLELDKLLPCPTHPPPWERTIGLWGKHKLKLSLFHQGGRTLLIGCLIVIWKRTNCSGQSLRARVATRTTGKKANKITPAVTVILNAPSAFKIRCYIVEP